MIVSLAYCCNNYIRNQTSLQGKVAYFRSLFGLFRFASAKTNELQAFSAAVIDTTGYTLSVGES